MGNTRKSDNTKRAAGMARKAEAADQKAAQQAAREEAEEEERWQKGTKGSNKKYVLSLDHTGACDDTALGSRKTR